MTKFLRLLMSTAGVAAIGFGTALAAGPAQAEQMGRDPWRFKVLNSPLALSRAIAIEQQEEDGFGTNVHSVITTTTSTFSSTSAENFTEILSNCGNDASCAVDAAIMRDGAGGSQSSATSSNGS